MEKLLSTLLIVEYESSDNWYLNLLNEETYNLELREPLPNQLNIINFDQNGIEPFINSLLEVEFLEAYRDTLTAIVFILPHKPDYCDTYFPLSDYPIQVFLISEWLASAYTYARLHSPQLFVLLDTSEDGRCSLVLAKDHKVTILGSSDYILSNLLNVSANEFTGNKDILIKALLAHPKFVDSFGIIDSPSIREKLDNISISRKNDLLLFLSVVLKPLITVLHNTSLVAEYSTIVCFGEFFQSYGASDIFRETIRGAMHSMAPDSFPEIVILPSSKSVGAARYVKSVINNSGVWASHFSRTSKLKIITDREIRYSVVHPPLFVFDLTEDTISQMVKSRPVLAIVDEKVDILYGNVIRPYFEQKTNINGYLLLNGDESEKKWEQVEKICNKAIDIELRRDGIMVAIGGGVILDVVGFAASIYRRGVPYLRIPTTLIGLVDVGVGIKQGINFGLKKNILGAFYPALASINDATFLKTLSEQDIAAGIAEILKMGIIKDKILFEILEKNGEQLLESKFQEPSEVAKEVMARAEQSMMNELQPNLYEQDLKRLVDFGHSFSPTIESKSNYSIAHGEAVGMDMLLCTFIAVQQKLCDKTVIERLINIYRKVGLPLTQNVANANDLFTSLDSIRAHRGGQLNLVVPTAIGSAEFIQEVSYTEVQQALTFVNSYQELI